MDLNAFEERYREMSTDELLNICVSSDLIDSASKALQSELERRGVTGNEITQSKSDNDYMLKMQNRPTKRLSKIVVNFLGVLFILAVMFIILIIKKGLLTN
jgi:hypothetical protein